MSKINDFVNRMIYWCEEGNLGYDQSNRWDIREGGECDCSSLVIYVLNECGFETGDSTYTGNLSENLCANGWKRVENNGNPEYGDILLNDKNHVAVYIGNGKLAQASIDENHKISGGKSGDQTGYETNIKNYYNYPWNCYLRYKEQEQTLPTLERIYKMEFLFKPYDYDYMCYWNGQGIIKLTHEDQMKVIQDCYKRCNDKDIPVFELGSENAPWYQRLAQCAAYIKTALTNAPL